MRKITNKAGLPQALVRAVQNDSYSKGDADFSTTQLAVPSRIVALKEQHKDEIEEDVADLIYALMGKLGHSILEQAGATTYVEKRLFWKMSDGSVVSGCLDIVDGDVIEDWKFTSVFTTKEGVKFDWSAQASVNRFLCEKNGIKITKARYIAILRDWSKTKTVREKDYPQTQVLAFDVPMWSLEDTEKWILERINSHKAAMLKLPLCTDEERWARGGGFAVMKKGRKSAVKLFTDLSSAQSFLIEQNDSSALSVETRSPANTRCQFYCPVLEFCTQAKNLGVTTEEANITHFPDTNPGAF